MKKLLVVLFIVVFVCAAQPARADMLPVGQLPHAERWTETVDTVNGPVEVNVFISLPEITALPIYEVVYRPFTMEEMRQAFPRANIIIEDTGAFVRQGDLGGMICPIDPDQCAWADWPEDSDYAEAVVESKQDVERKLQARLNGLYGGGRTSLWTRGVIAHSRTWRKARTGELLEPVNEHGYYDFYLELALDGVTVFDQVYFNRDNPKNSGPHAESVQMTYYDENNLTVSLTDFELIRTVAQDAPILPLEEIKATLRTFISAGYLREIYRMELCYLPMWSDNRDSIMTVPAWVVHGEYHEAAKAPDYEDTDNYYLRTLGGYALVIPAQTGQALDARDANPNRWLASTYLTEW